MNFGLSFSLGGFIFLFILFVHYLKQTHGKVLNLRQKTYRSLLIIMFIYCVIEVLEFIHAYTIDVYVMGNICWKLRTILGNYLLFYTLCYFDLFLGVSKVNNLKELLFGNVIKKIVFLIITLISAVIAFHFNLELLPPDELFVFEIGPIMIINIVITIIFVFSLVGILYKYLTNGEVKNIKKVMPVIGYIVILIASRATLICPKMLSMATFNVLSLYLMFLVRENPDIEIEEDLEKLSESIQKSSNAKLDFLFNMSNDVKDSMNNMVGFSQSLRNVDLNDNEKISYFVKNIKFSGNALVDSLNNILDISRIESGEEKLNLRQYSINDLFEDLPNIIGFKIGERPIKYEMNISSDICSVLEGDAGKVLQIVTNILSNAVKYTEVGRVELRVSGRKENDKEFVTFRISDTGCGMKKEEMDELNDRLNGGKANSTTQDGLGLVIAKKYVDLMGGKLWFESEFRSGSIFYVEIPQKIISPVPLSNVQKNVEEHVIEYFDCSKYKLLVVEDDKLNCKVLTKLLSKYNFDVTVVNSGRECINKIKAEEKYDMILLDHKMPELDGVQTLEILKKLETYILPPIVAITANVFIGVEEIYYRAGFNDYLAKPINMEDLNKLVIKYFKKDA